MQINCYHCKTTPLQPTKLDFGLPALRCQDCQGTYLDLLTYRSWLENVADDIEAENASDKVVEIDELSNTEKALICQRCHKFMTKYRINHQHDNTINVCTTCDDVWLDTGEWELLKQLKIQDKLTDVMSSPWQKAIANEEEKQVMEKHHRQKFGEDFDRINEFALWLAHHPQKSQIRSYLLNQ